MATQKCLTIEFQTHDGSKIQDRLNKAISLLNKEGWKVEQICHLGRVDMGHSNPITVLVLATLTE